MGLKRNPTVAYASAYKCADAQHRDAAKVNYARALTRVEKYDVAAKLYSEVEAASFSSGTGLALALYKSNYLSLLYIRIF